MIIEVGQLKTTSAVLWFQQTLTIILHLQQRVRYPFDGPTAKLVHLFGLCLCLETTQHVCISMQLTLVQTDWRQMMPNISLQQLWDCTLNFNIS